MTYRGLALFISVLLIFSLAGCGISSFRQAPDAEQSPFFVPPTLMPTPLPPTETPTVSPAESAATQAAVCSNNLTFLSDLTIPDGTLVAPGSTIDKRWEVENSGSCNWEEGYRINMISGSEMGAIKEQALIPARSGSRVAIRIIFTAPNEPGKYRSVWQAFDPQGNAFGDPLFIEVQVKKSE